MLYTDFERMREFITEAVKNVPGVEDCMFCIDGVKGDSVTPTIFGLCGACPNFHEGIYRIQQDNCPYEENDGYYVIPLRTYKNTYGFAVVTLNNPEEFRQFEAAVHNFANTIALHIENTDYQKNLKAQVKERTEDLKQANNELHMSNAFFQSVFESTDDRLVVIDLDYNVIQMNSSAKKFLVREENSGTAKCYALFFGRDQPCEVCPVQALYNSESPHNKLVPYPDEENPQIWFDFSASPIFNEEGEIVRILESGRDITEIKHLQEDLKKNAEEKELLLREIHHRVKNNLNVVVSLLKIQLGTFKDEQVHEALQVSIDRIRSMALVHQYLYRSETHDSIDFKGFILDFVADISHTYETSGRVHIIPDFEEVSVNIDLAVPVSLIINELVTNALKYAFPSSQEGTIYISIATLSDGRIKLTVRDNGIGLPEDFDFTKTETLGMQIIKGLVRQLEGEVIIDGEGGTSFSILFKP